MIYNSHYVFNTFALISNLIMSAMNIMIQNTNIKYVSTLIFIISFLNGVSLPTSSYYYLVVCSILSISYPFE